MVALTSYHSTIGNSEVMSLEVYCNNKSNGCEWIGKIGSLEKHLAECDFAFLSCPNKCKDGDGIIQKLLRKDKDHHVKVCPRRQYNCLHCNEQGEYWERTSIHMDKCPNVKITCPNPDCNQRIARCRVSEHRTTNCQFETVQCKYAKVGCPTQLCRKGMIQHEDDSQLHLTLVMDTVLQMQCRIDTNEMIADNLNGLIMKFINFEQNKGRIRQSKPFHTSHGGYCMCIKVYANGNGDGDSLGSCVSVFVYLMRGNNDDCLPWPFTGTVTIELLNQLEDKNHISRSTRFLSDEDVSQ